MRCILVILLFATAITAITANAADEDFYREEIKARIAPVGRVQVEGNSLKNTKPKDAKATAPVNVNKAPGQATYEAHCIVCHADGIAGAPKFQNASDWASRIAKSKLDEMVQIAIRGINAMPPKGTCTECNEEDIKKAIQYMLPK